MTQEEFNLAVEDMVLGGLVLPHGVFPGSYPGGVQDLSDEAIYNAYQWNPPMFLAKDPLFSEYSEIDQNASPKPSYRDIEERVPASVLRSLRHAQLISLQRECRRRITAAYGERNSEEEIYLRLREETPAQDIERDRLRTKYRERRDWINGDDTGLQALKDFDVTADLTWA